MDEKVFLMYHELELPGRALCETDSGYIRYILRISEFEAQIRWLRQADCQGFDVSTALAHPKASGVAITFDDGSETDLIAAAPILKAAGFKATFYITSGFLGRPGYLTRSQVLELSNFGFEIGCHSMTHAYLTDLDETCLKREIMNSKQQLEEITGRQVLHFSCPGGRYNRRVIAVAQDAGYRTLATSHARANSICTSPFELGRVPIMRQVSLHEFGRICRNHGLWKLRLREVALNATKRSVGNSNYDRLRRILLTGRR